MRRKGDLFMMRRILECFCVLFILQVLCGPRVTAVRSENQNLKIILEVPRWAKVGGTVTMHCKYDVGGEPVYQVKWYKGNKEFYRYVPKESPPVKIFPFAGLHLDLSRSNASAITLNKLDLSMKGTYSCEVSTDYPDFLTDVKSSILDVVAFPESGPTISKLKSTYSVGDMVEANCTSYRSKPFANLTWFINSELVKPQFLVPPGGFRIKENPMETSQLNLRFQLRPEHFRANGRVTMKCTARIYDYYHNSSEATIFEADNPKLSSVVDNTSSSSGSSGNIRGDKNSSSSLHGTPLGSHRYFTGIKLLLIVLMMPQHLLCHILLIN
ncbi:unnamed protein product [Allacma fusca]|uniref:Ig-like domain-containing protein n=1 Tax=Allacma fusca TaxID=39272 RepID=A0A8J2KFC0_9HEXA|nr:unnamed protein product [Allacma fusca]